MFKRVLGAFLALLMLLSVAACGKKEEELIPGGQRVVATVYGHEITKQQLYVAMAAYVNQYDMTMTDIAEEPELRKKLVSDFITDTVMDYALTENASRYGYTYSAEEEAAFEAEFESFLATLDESNKKDTLGEGKTEAEFETQRDELRQQYYLLTGYDSEEAYKEYQKCAYISSQVEKCISSSVTVDANAVRAYYDNLLAAGKTDMGVTYTFSLANPSIQLYCENGYRYVKPLMLEFPAASVLSNVEYYTAGDTAKLNAAIERDVAYMQDTIDEIRAKLADGVPFDTLVEEYGEDVAMSMEPYKSRGYIAVTGDANAISSYREACETLTDTEMVAECATYNAYYFLQASEIVAEGPMPFEEIKSRMTNELTAMKQNLQYSETTAALLEELKASGDISINEDNFYKE